MPAVAEIRESAPGMRRSQINWCLMRALPVPPTCACPKKDLPETQHRAGRGLTQITAFFPTNMYAADHIERATQATLPALVNSQSFKVGASQPLNDQALHRILDIAGGVGPVLGLHNERGHALPKPDQER
jgi:hypothetical protein